ncbi:proteasomal ATPase-associated factor 1-like [Macrosteles quadrilineatus]|uniref:proteasomal ATPase-associated factor 1-like n=1 Tax=Macrosteles quadrilineatus TaxID=74068 RepID=UPI0023E0ABEF|nr:proteasomal ATPase-associated factor 1-like [Macrosteles quadrilineatus]
MTSINSITILQSDWDDILWKLEGEVWVVYKKKDEKSIQGKLRCVQIGTSGLPKITGTNGFAVEKVGKDFIQVKYKDAPFTSLFLAASKVYSGIHKKGITSLSVSSKGLSVSVCKDNQLLVWDFNQGELKCTLSGHVGDVYKCKFFPSGVVVLSGGADMQLKVWCAMTGKCPVTLTGHTMAVTDFDFIDKGKNILSVSKDGTAKLWSCSAACCIADIAKLSSTINCCHVFSAPFLSLGVPSDPPSEEEVETKDKAVLLGCEDGSVHCVAVYSRKKLFSFNCSTAVNTVTTLSTSYFIVGCHSGEVFLFDIKDAKAPIETWFESNSAVLCVVAFKEEGFFCSHADGLTVYRNVRLDDKRVVLTGPDCDPVYDICTDNQFVYTCSRDALIRRYNVERIIQQFVNE